MQDVHRDEFNKAIRTTFELYGKGIADNLLEVWWSHLRRYTIDTLRSALKVYSMEGRYAPRPAEILKLCRVKEPERQADAYQHRYWMPSDMLCAAIIYETSGPVTVAKTYDEAMAEHLRQIEQGYLNGHGMAGAVRDWLEAARGRGNPGLRMSEARP